MKGACNTHGEDYNRQLIKQKLYCPPVSRKKKLGSSEKKVLNFRFSLQWNVDGNQRFGGTYSLPLQGTIRGSGNYLSIQEALHLTWSVVSL
jgi:hypothetical protein